MANTGNENKEVLTQDENITSSEAGLNTPKEGKSKAASNKGKGKAADSKEARKKKQDALEGKESKQRHSESEEEKPHHPSDKPTSDDAGSHSRQGGLQSGQTTVQFSSGGMTASLSSLLGLFASSATLARTEISSFLNISNQASNLNIRTTYQSNLNPLGIIVGDEGKGQKGTTNIFVEQASDSVSGKLNLDIGATTIARTVNNLPDTLSSILKNISVRADVGKMDVANLHPVTVFSAGLGGFVVNLGFNAGGFFFPEGLNFAYSSRPGVYSGVISTILESANLTTGNSYTYRIINPFNVNDTSTNLATKSGITITSAGDLQLNIADAPYPAPTVAPTGITLTGKGDLFVNTPQQPMSILLIASPVGGGGTELPIRINVGPINLVEAPNNSFLPNTLTAPNTNGTPIGAVLRATGENMLVGYGTKFSYFVQTISGPGSGPGSTTYIGKYEYTGYNGSILSGQSLGNGIQFTFPGNVLFRHIGTDLETIPEAPAYGNFIGIPNPDFPNVGNNTIIMPPPSIQQAINLRLGGNVLDVYGTKFGVADVMDIRLASSNGTVSQTILPANTVTMGGNVLAGFGKAYGDLQTLSLTAIANSNGITEKYTDLPEATKLTAPVNIEFKSNLLQVDKEVSSELFPHLQNLEIKLVPGPQDNLNHVTLVYNIHIKFNNSIIEGNSASNVFYGDIQNLGDLGKTNLYNGFITGVTAELDASGHWVITTPSAITVDSTGSQILSGNNSITWGNNIYKGGHTGFNAESVNTFNFTLVGNLNGQPIFPGNSIIKDFIVGRDVLNFQITPAVFRTLDLTHQKTINLDSWNFAAENAFHYGIIPDPNNPTSLGGLGLGTTILFNGGGSLALVGLNLSNFNTLLAENIKYEINLTYSPISDIQGLKQPLVFGMGPTNFAEGPYYNAVDNLFNNSLLATYVAENLPPGVTIDNWGTITVQNSNPLFQDVTIHADDHQGGTITTTFFMGFLNAPVVKDLNINSIVIAEDRDARGHVLQGGQGSTIFGGPEIDYSYGGVGFHKTFSFPITLSDPALISDSSPGATSYGTSRTLTFTVQGLPDIDIEKGNTSYDPSVIKNHQFATGKTASYIIGTSYGVAEELTINALGGNNPTFHFSKNPAFLTADIDNFANFENNKFDFGSNTMYGAGSIYGDFEQISIIVRGGLRDGTRPLYDLSQGTSLDDVDGAKLDVTGSVKGNEFHFSSTHITVLGDATGQTTTIWGSLDKLDITVQNGIKYNNSAISVKGTATFASNSFVFEDSVFIGGKGNTVFNGHIQDMGDPYGFAKTGADKVLNGYTGFVTGVNVSVDNLNHLTVTDKKSNSITYGNNTYTGGEGTNTYNFTIVQDMLKRPVMQGHDTIMNFDPTKDVIVFNFEANLFKNLNMTQGDLRGNILKLDAKGYVSLADGYIQFRGDALLNGQDEIIGYQDYGSITLSGTNLSTFGDLYSYITGFGGHTPIRIESDGTQYAPPVLVDPPPYFDPVLVNAPPLTDVFEGFVEGDLPTLSYNIISSPSPDITIDESGALSVNVNGPVEGMLTVAVFDGITEVALNPIHIFAINASDNLIHKESSLLLKGSDIQLTYGDTITTEYSLAFETSTPGNTIIGGGNNITYLPTNIETTVTYGSNLIYDVSTLRDAGITTGHTVYGNVEKILFANDGLAINGAPQTLETELSGQTLIFNSNLFNVNAFDTNSATNGAGIYGNAKELTMIAAGATLDVLDGESSSPSPIRSIIKNNHITFNSNTEYGSGNMYGALKILSLLIVDAADTVANQSVGNGFIQGNEFTFGPNFLTSQPVSETFLGSADLYAGIGSLVMSITESSTYTHTGVSQIGGTNPGEGNIFTFGDSILKGGAVTTNFHGDIADLSNTYFASSPVTVTTNNDHVQIMDTFGNTLNLGNNTFISSTTHTSSYFLNVLSTGQDAAPVVLGNVTIENFLANSTNILHLNLAQPIFKKLDTNYNRSIDTTIVDNHNEFSALVTEEPTHPNDTDTKFSFSGGGSITLTDTNFDDLSDLGTNLEASLIYVPGLVTPHDTNPQPLVLSTTGGTHGGTTGLYGLALDDYFDHIDIGDVRSTYTIANALSSQVILNVPEFGIVGTPYLTEVKVFDTAFFGTLQVNDNNSLIPHLAPVIVTTKDFHNTGNTVQLSLIIAEFNGNTVNSSAGNVLQDPNTGLFIGAYDSRSALQGLYSNEVMIGNAQDFNTAPSEIRTFGYNLITNMNEGTIAYGDFQSITFNSDNAISNSEYDFGANAFAVNGTVHGTAGTFSISDLNSYFTGNTFTFGPTTIYGHGTIFGDLNALKITSTGYVQGNTFVFEPTHIAILGDGPSTVYTNINTADFIFQNDTHDNHIIFKDSVVVTGTGPTNIYTGINDLSNTVFWNTQLLAAETDFMGNFNGFFIGDHLTVADHISNQFTKPNTITWGNNNFYLAAGIDTVHINLLSANTYEIGSDTNPGFAHEQAAGPQQVPILPGNISIYDFDPSKDIIRLNLSPLLYSELIAADPLSGLTHSSLTGTSLSLFKDEGNNSTVEVLKLSVDRTTIFFHDNLGTGDFGRLDIHFANGAPAFETLSDFGSRLQLGTTFVGTLTGSIYGESEFAFRIPDNVTNFSSFTEYDHIKYFDVANNKIGIVMSQKLYDLSQTGVLKGISIADALEASTHTSAGGISISKTTPAQFTSENGINVDSTLNFITKIGADEVTTGSIVLHNVDVDHLSDLGSSFRLAQAGTNTTDTFTYVVPGVDFSSFSNFGYITNFDTTGVTTKDNLQIILSPTLYKSLSSDGTLDGTVNGNALSAHVNDSIGGIKVTTSGISTTLAFQANGFTAGEITLLLTNIADLNALGDQLHVGYVEQGTSGVDVFDFNVTGSNFASYTQFNHITDFDVTKDIIHITVPIDVYYSINSEGLLKQTNIINSLISNASTSASGITTGVNPTAQYLGADDHDTIISFQKLGITEGSITLHNVDTNLTHLGSQFHFGSSQSGTGAIDNFYFNTVVNGPDNFSAFQQFDRISGFNFGTDNIDIALSKSLYDLLSSNGTIDGGFLQGIIESSANSTTGGIKVTTVDGSTNLEFVTTNNSVSTTWGSILLEGVTTPTGHLTDFGSHLRFGSIEQGTTAADTFTFNANTSNDLSSFKGFNHIVDFNPTQDTLTINISQSLYDRIDSFIYDPLTHPAHATTSEVINALEAGVNIQQPGPNGLARLQAVEVPAEYSGGSVNVDTVINFLTNGNLTGSITLHNVNLTGDLSTLPNLLIHHA